MKQWAVQRKRERWQREERDFPFEDFPFERGYSLIEMLVVIVLLIMLAIVGTSLFVNTLTGSNKTTIALQLKQQGEYAMSQMLSMIRGSVRIESCGGSSIVIRNPDESTTQFFLENTKIASNSGSYLTGNELRVTAGPVFTCTEENGVYTFANITFTLKHGDPQVDKPIEVVEQAFVGGAAVRKY